MALKPAAAAMGGRGAGAAAHTLRRQSGSLATGIGKALLYPTFEDCKKSEGSAKEAGMRLSAGRPALLQCKGRASEARRLQRERQKRKQKKKPRQPKAAAAAEGSGSGGSEWNAGYSSADSAGEGESVASMILGPGGGIAGLLE